MKEQFTKGPWAHKRLGDTNKILITADPARGFAVICEIGGIGTAYKYKDREANARLIAAAPEMFEALQKLIEIPVSSATCPLNYNATVKAVARRAINKIKGDNTP